MAAVMEATMEHDDPTRRRGLPVQVRLHDELLNNVDGWRRQQRDLPSRPEAIRRCSGRQC